MLRPHLFRWEGRTYKVTELHSYYQTRQGRAVLHHWTASANDSVYALEWNSETLEWRLVGVDEEAEPSAANDWRKYQKV